MSLSNIACRLIVLTDHLGTWPIITFDISMDIHHNRNGTRVLAALISQASDHSDNVFQFNRCGSYIFSTIPVPDNLLFWTAEAEEKTA
jgi:hypothetical protein